MLILVSLLFKLDVLVWIEGAPLRVLLLSTTTTLLTWFLGSLCFFENSRVFVVLLPLLARLLDPQQQDVQRVHPVREWENLHLH